MLYVFDLDGLVWYPEMYHLWGSGGSPFSRNGLDVDDAAGARVRALGDLRPVLNELLKDDTNVLGVASSCDEPEWALECLSLFRLDESTTFEELFGDRVVVQKASSKQIHFKRLREITGIDYAEMVFFDNEMHNCRSVAKLGVTCVYSPSFKGVSTRHLDLIRENFPNTDGSVLEL